MKSVAELGVIAGVALVAGLGNWLIAGKPSPDPVAELEKMPVKEGEISLSQALKESGDGLLWIDARSEEAWRKESMRGSINITMQSDESLGEQITRHQEALFGAGRLIVFCDDVHCSVSHDLSERLKGEFRDLVAGEVLVLHGGMTVLRDAGLTTGSSSGP